MTDSSIVQTSVESTADPIIENPTTHHRPIRSFVIRSGRMTRAQSRAMDAHWQEYGIGSDTRPNNATDDEAKSNKLDYQQLFDRQAPTFLEIGFGMGQSLVAMAKMRPQDNFIGVDVCEPGIGSVIGLAVREQVKNLRIVQGDAVELLRHRITEQSLSGVYIFFPDPWHKRRHHKRRLIQSNFVDLIISRLRIGGHLHAATDWEDYARHISKTLASSSLTNQAPDSEYCPRPDYRSLTKYEARGQRLGHGVWDLIYQKN
ncbi:MAG: tRNA (guanosine(46)-N7)-methyltransferase TrmB [Immundisolibacteraceae bacterium]|nr:tRNA (guanosine(46)-N7)-methyltransferase TrmB [Immundisolibacteraceae bacterium]